MMQSCAKAGPRHWAHITKLLEFRPTHKLVNIGETLAKFGQNLARIGRFGPTWAEDRLPEQDFGNCWAIGRQLVGHCGARRIAWLNFRECMASNFSAMCGWLYHFCHSSARPAEMGPATALMRLLGCKEAEHGSGKHLDAEVVKSGGRNTKSDRLSRWAEN